MTSSWIHRALAVVWSAGAVELTNFASLRTAVELETFERIELSGSMVFKSAIVVNRSVTIAGPAVLEGHGSSRLFHVLELGDLVLESVRLVNGFEAEADGGAVLNEGRLATINTNFTKNRCPKGNGGAVFNVGRFVASTTIIDNNEARENGGGVYNDGDLSLTDSWLVRNHATVGDGAGIYNTGFITVNATTILGNWATSRSGGGFFNDGGTAVALDASFRDNQAYHLGGGVHNQGDGIFECVRCVLERNAAAVGGALSSRATTVLRDVALLDNVASADGGGIGLLSGKTSLEGVVVRGNRANRGGFAYVEAVLFCWRVSADANFATMGTAIFVGDQTTGARIEAWHAIDRLHGLEIGRSEGRDCGAIAIGFGARAEIFGVKSQNNKAPVGAFVHVNPSASLNLTHVVSLNDTSVFDGVILVGLHSRLSLADAVIEGAQSAGGSGIIYAVGSASLHVEDTIFDLCQATAVYAKALSGALTLADVRVLDSTSGVYIESTPRAVIQRVRMMRTAGSSLYVTGEVHATVRETTIAEAESAVFVGGLATVDFFGCSFTANSPGGALDLRGSARIEQTTFEKNSNDVGGALVVSGSLDCQGATFRGNAAQFDGGGAIAARAGAHLSLTDTLFADNIALEGSGGALMLSAETSFSTRDVRFESNAAPFGGGGAVFVDMLHPEKISMLFIDLTNIVFEGGNTAAYGDTVATTPAALSVEHAGNQEAAGKYFQTPITVEALDFFDQRVATLSGAVTRLAFNATTSDGDVVAQGPTNLEFVQGIAKTSGSFALFYFPASIVQVSATFGELVSTTTVELRDCAPGEVADSKGCRECDENTFWDDGHCRKCRTGMACDYPAKNVPLNDRILSTLLLKRGWWRGSANSDELYRCPMDENACPNDGARAGDEICGRGYTGSKCAACESGYFSSVTAGDCRKCDRRLGIFVFFVLALVIVVSVFGVFAVVYPLTWNKMKRRSSKIYEVSSFAAFKVAWATFQIVVSIDTALGIKYPQPLGGFIDTMRLVQLDPGFLPIACLAKYDFHRRLLFSTVAPLAIVALFGAAAYPLHAQFFPHHANARLRAGYAELALFVSFVVYPTSSAVIFQTFQCDSVAFYPDTLRADPSIECNTNLHSFWRLYAALMIFCVPIGIPACYCSLLASKKRRICPAARNDDHQVLLRAHDRSLDSIRLLFDAYTPRAYAFELFECFRRLVLVALMPLAASHKTHAAATSMTIAMLVGAAYREVHPFRDEPTNKFADACCWFVVTMYGAASMLSVDDVVRDEYDDSFRPYDFPSHALGTSLLVLNVVVLVVAARLACVRKPREHELQLLLAESRFREVEVDMDVIELRADIDSLQASKSPVHFDDDDDDRSKSKEASHNKPETRLVVSPPPLMQLDSLRNINWLYKDEEPEPAFETRDYPCYVISLSSLQTLDRVVIHEDALSRGLLSQLTETTTYPSSALTYFVSHNWETRGAEPHPDNDCNTKLEWLKNIRSHLGLPQTVEEVWLWWDYVSIPQRSRFDQRKAAASLARYSELCARFLPLVRDESAWKELYGQDLGPAPRGSLPTYMSRAWCRLEVLAALAPKKFASGAFRPGPRNLRFRFHHDPTSSGVGPLLTTQFLKNPLTGHLSLEDDRDLMRPVVLQLAKRFADYAESGSDAWDSTLDVFQRPDWLKVLAGVETCENPLHLAHVPDPPRPLRPAASKSELNLDVDGLDDIAKNETSPVSPDTSPRSPKETDSFRGSFDRDRSGNAAKTSSHAGKASLSLELSNWPTNEDDAHHRSYPTFEV